jgi:hypothetical protein
LLLPLRLHARLLSSSLLSGTSDLLLAAGLVSFGLPKANRLYALRMRDSMPDNPLHGLPLRTGMPHKDVLLSRLPMRPGTALSHVLLQGVPPRA